MLPAEAQNRLSALEKVLQITRDMAATADLDELLGVIIARSMELLASERATLFLYDPDTDELVSKIAHGAEEIRLGASAGIAGAAAAARQVLNIPDAYADERFNREVDRVSGFRTRNILAVPLVDYSGDLVGVLEVLNKRGGAYTDDDVSLAQTLGAQAGVILQRARLLAHYVQKQRMEQSLAIARQIQQDLLPSEAPRVEGFDVAGWSRPADETGGDIYDFFQLAPDKWTLTLADATGHGVGPALVVAEARAMLRALSCKPDGASLDIAAVLQSVNSLLTQDLDSGRFVTCFFALLDGPGKSVRYASAGQGPILFYDHAADEFEQLAATALPLGVMADTAFDQQVERKFKVGDMMAVVTDGFFEAPNPQQQQFGMDRIRKILRRDRDRSASQIIQGLHREVDRFTGSYPQADDLTAIVVKRT